MSSSQVLSPHTPSLGLHEESPSGSRTRFAKAKARRLAATLTSPVPTNASSSTTHSTRSRTRQSHSPEKKGASDLTRASPRTRRSRASDESHVSAQDEEGESELDADVDAEVDVPVSAQSDNDNESSADEAPKVPISLTINRKRKATVVVDGNESELTPEAEECPAPPTLPEEESVVDDPAEDDEPDADKADEDYGLPKRAPRKKRKWLKKGEVDPDDPIAVAKQKERHALIDEALLLLDKQIEMIENETHPQLTWMLEELERRYKRRVSQVDAKQEAVLLDLQKMRNHEEHQAMENWGIQRDDLVDTMTNEINFKIGKIEQERNALKRTPNDYPNMREGRGGGGWKTYEDHLLSKHQEKLVRVAHNSSRVRKAVSIDVKGIGNHAARAELDRMWNKPQPRSPSPPRMTQGRRYVADHHRVSGPEIKKPVYAEKPASLGYPKHADLSANSYRQSRPLNTQQYPTTATPSTAQLFPPRVKSMFGEPIGGAPSAPPKAFTGQYYSRGFFR